MEIEKLPSSLLQGKLVHCKPVENGPVVKAHVVRSDDEFTPLFKVVILCPMRLPSSKCEIRVIAGHEDDHCQYWTGDSKGVYQIIGPGMVEKLAKEWE